MTVLIHPDHFKSNDNIANWDIKYPVWLSTVNEILKGTYNVPPHYQSVVITNDTELKCISNICTHKQSIIFDGCGKYKNSIVCPIHKWSWDKNGELISSRGIDPCQKMNLSRYKTTEWEGHLFLGDTNWLEDINLLGNLTQYLNINKYTKRSHHSLEYNFDWKIFYEIFLDLYHVKPVHPGLRSLTDCDTFDWKFGKDWSCQTALFNKNTPSEENYRQLYEIYKRTGHYESAKYGAVWLGIYPNIMLEYYPGCFVVSTVWPNGSGKCINYLDFYYETGLLEDEPTFYDIHQRCFMDTAKEDEEIGLRISKGRSLLSDTITMFNHTSFEAGTKHFYNWLNL